MKIQNFLFIILFSVLLIGETFAQSIANSGEIKIDLEASDWSVLFPEMQGCERKIQNWGMGDTFLVYANYIRESDNPGSSNQNGKSYLCGKIEYIFSVSGKTIKPQSSNFKPMPWYRPFKIKNFDASRVTPKCGVGSPGISIHVYFDNDKTLNVTAQEENKEILKFAERADYEKIKSAINKFVNSIKQT